jgi:hypothetical protein
MRIQLPKPLAVALAFCCSVPAAFCLLFGVAEWLHPDVPAEYMAAYPWRNTVACMVVIAIGLFFLALALVTVRGAFFRKDSA